MRAYRALRVAAIERETDRAASVVFALPDELRETFRWRPGQHLNLRFEIGGEELRRSYSISSSPLEGPLRITVQRVHQGRVSNHVHDSLRPGDTVEVMPPTGGFCLDPDARARRTHYFFGAGSGITPLYSMLTSVLLGERHSFAYLLYGNRKADSILFRQPLERLCEQHGERLRVVHTLSRPGLWSSFAAWKGIVDASAVARFLELHPPYAQDTQYYVCGPGDMNSAVRTALMGLDVPSERIHMESYGAGIGTEPVDDETTAGIAATARVELYGETLEIDLPPGKTVLRALLDAGHDAPYSCEAGVCSTCRARLGEGSVRMRHRAALEDDEIERGAILTCQAIATSERLALRFETP